MRSNDRASQWDAGKAASREHPLAGCKREANTASVPIIAATPWAESIWPFSCVACLGKTARVLPLRCTPWKTINYSSAAIMGGSYVVDGVLMGYNPLISNE